MSCCSYWFGSTCIQRLRHCYSFWVQPLLFSLTLLHIDEFFNKKVAPKDLVGEIKQLNC
ncbi:hypothetical protein GQ55_6G077000 [Panicum hallii var. hallii]|nr:hypothetical protein GQ55_6G077000 [Panicum hallii var. hallii]